ARIAELQREMQYIHASGLQTAIDRVALQKETVLRELASVGFVNLFDYIRQTPDGELVVDLAAAGRDKGAGLIEFQMTETGEGASRKRKVRIRLGQKVPALALLGKHLALFVDRQETGDQPLRQLTTEELKRRLADIDRKLDAA